jgi:hypothetical protein
MISQINIFRATNTSHYDFVIYQPTFLPTSINTIKVRILTKYTLFQRRNTMAKTYPSVDIQEKDILAPLVAPSTSGRLAYVVESSEGAHDEFVFITSETDLVNKMGEPSTDRESRDFLICAEYLRYANDLVLRRAKSSIAKNSRIAFKVGTGGLSVDLLNALGDITYIDKVIAEGHTVTTSNKLEFYARTAGVRGDLLKVSFCTPDDFYGTVTGSTRAEIVDGTYFDRQFEFAPDATRKEIALAVILDGEIIEKHIVSLEDGTLDDLGRNIYITDWLLANSAYIYGFASSDVWTYIETNTEVSLVDGDSGNTEFNTANNLTAAVQTAYDYFKSKTAVSFNYITEGNHNNNREDVVTVVETRRDCMAFVGPAIGLIQGIASNDTIVSNLINDRNSISLNSSFVAYYGNIKKTFERYRKKDFWIPITGDAAGVKVRNNTINEVWTAPAGYTYGGILNVKALGFNPDDTQQGNLYSSQINHIFQKPGRGVVIFGQKTLLNKNSGFNRINVRDLFNYIETTIGSFAENFLFEVNDAITRNQFVNTVTPFLAELVTRRGITDFKIIADESVNTPAVIDNNEFRATFLIKPSKTIEFITLTFVNTPASTSFAEAATV